MAGPRKLPPLSEAQLEIMNLVWEAGELSVGQILERLQTRREVARNTVQTVLSRLEQRGWLTSRMEGNKYIYRATQGRVNNQKRLVQKLIDSAFSGSVESLVRTLLSTQPLTEEEIERIQILIDEARERKP